MRAMSFHLHQDDDRPSEYTSPFCASTTYCNQDVHIGVEVGCGDCQLFAPYYAVQEPT